MITLALLTGAAALAAASLAGADGEGGTVRVDAIFDSSGFLVTDEEVRIAGAPVGTITGLELTDDYKARVAMEIDAAFAPFRADADCTIQPQSLIGDRFVECTPGTAGAPELSSEDGYPPTVPVENTHTPVDLDLVLSTFDKPTRARLGIILSSLGAGAAGRSEELEEVIRRSNPALGETKKLLEIVSSERRRIGSLVDESDRILAELAGRKDRIGDFVDASAEATAATAAERTGLEATIRNLPPLLRELEPSLDRVREIARDGEPVLSDLQGSADSLDRVLAELPAFAREGRPALAALGSAAERGKETVRAAKPQVHRLDALIDQARDAAPLISELLVSIRDAGALEGLQRFIYNAARTVARFDDVSHLAGAYLFFSSLCSLVTPIPIAGCDAHWDSFDRPAARRASWLAPEAAGGSRKSALGELLEGGREAIGLPGGAGSGSGSPGIPAPGNPGAPGGGPGPGGGGGGGAPPAPGGQTPAPTPGPGSGAPAKPNAIRDLLDFLTGS